MSILKQRDFNTYYGEYSLKNWIRMILNEEITLPKYQRYFVWKLEMSVKLMETLIHGKFVPPVVISSFSGDNSTGDKSVNYVLDGQQRLSAILLCFLGFWPTGFNYDGTLINEDNTNDDGSLMEDDSSESQDWDFKYIQEIYSTIKDLDELKKKLLDNKKYSLIESLSTTKDIKQNDIERYKALNLNESRFRDSYLGFSYIKRIENNSNEEKKLFSHIFRNINTSSVALSPLESREAFYWLRPDRRDFLQPIFAQKIIVNKKKFDWARSLAYVAEVSKIYESSQRINTSTVAKKYGTSANPYEYYIEKYVSCVVDGEADERFEAYNDSYLSRVRQVEAYYDQLIGNKQYSSLVDADFYFFGLIFWVIFQKKDLNVTKETLTSNIEDAIKPFKKELKESGKLGRIRTRLQKSIELYEAYIV